MRIKKSKRLEFDKVMDLYDELSPKGREVRLDRALTSVTPETVAERIREAIRLSEQLIWKKPSKR